MTELAIKKKPRPKNLDLTTIRLPVPGIVSILHRVSGAGLFLMLPLILFLFQASVSTPESFEVYRSVIANPLVKIIVFGLLWSYMHHFCAGIRFLLLDVHVGVDKEAARSSSKVVLFVSLVATAFLGAKFLW